MSLRHTELNNRFNKNEIDTTDECVDTTDDCEYLIEEMLAPESAVDPNDEREKCGDIFISNRNFIFVCAFCDACFNNMPSFGEHIEGKHSLDKEKDIDHTEVSTNMDGIVTAIKIEPEDISINCTEGGLSWDDSVTSSDSEFDQIGLANKIQITKDPDLFCEICNRHYKSRRTFKQHQIRHQTTNQCQEYTKTEPKDDTAIHPNLYCEICNRHFKTTSIFRAHAARHDKVPLALQQDPNYLKCKYCDKQCTDHKELVAHERTHVGKRRFACSYCLKCFQTNQQRKLHIYTHTGERPFKCNECPKAFAHVTNLKRHIQAHLGIKRYDCEICGKQFVQNSAREGHMRTHTGEKPFQCEECGQSFILCSKLTEHRKRHTGIKNFKCEICGSLFYSNKALKGHKVKHSDARPFECSECGSNFSRRKALQAHVKIHSVIKQYVCNICSKEFAQAAGLYSHKKSHGEKLSLKWSND